jgi:hypothetical protein
MVAVYGLRIQYERLRAVVTEVLAGEREKCRLTAAGENGEESSLALALQEMDVAPVALFVTVGVLDLGPWGEGGRV